MQLCSLRFPESQGKAGMARRLYNICCVRGAGISCLCIPAVAGSVEGRQTAGQRPPQLQHTLQTPKHLQTHTDTAWRNPKLRSRPLPTRRAGTGRERDTSRGVTVMASPGDRGGRRSVRAPGTLGGLPQVADAVCFSFSSRETCWLPVRHGFHG